MSTKFTRFQVEWWVISKKTIYGLVLLGFLLLFGAGLAVYSWLYGNPLDLIRSSLDSIGNNLNEDEREGARFISFEGDVKVVRASSQQTLQAKLDTMLYPGDIVQTQANSRARIVLADGSTLVVRPNSVVIIRDNTLGQDGKRTNVRVAIDRGQINVRTEEQDQLTSNVVETRQTQNRLHSQTGATFGVLEDNTEDIRVSSGEIETTTASGVKTSVKSGEYVAINQTGTIARRENLLASPKPLSPQYQAKIFVTQGQSATVPLNWLRPASGAPAHYRVEVATSPFFVEGGKVVERNKLASTVFNVGELRPGIYFWRVRAVAISGQESEWTEPQKFIIASKGTNELTINQVNVEYLAGNVYIVSGNSQPGTTIRVNGRITAASSDGRFQLQFTLPRGTKRFMLTAEDERGNSREFDLSVNTRSNNSSS
jgi:hypothetical protein